MTCLEYDQDSKWLPPSGSNSGPFNSTGKSAASLAGTASTQFAEDAVSREDKADRSHAALKSKSSQVARKANRVDDTVEELLKAPSYKLHEPSVGA